VDRRVHAKILQPNGRSDGTELSWSLDLWVFNIEQGKVRRSRGGRLVEEQELGWRHVVDLAVGSDHIGAEELLLELGSRSEGFTGADAVDDEG
jgi:hypothetical protein